MKVRLAFGLRAREKRNEAPTEVSFIINVDDADGADLALCAWTPRDNEDVVCVWSDWSNIIE